MDCPQCGYALTPFDKECLRCKRAAAEAFARSPAAVWPPAIGDQTPAPPPVPPSYVAPPIRYEDDSAENTSGGEYGTPLEVAELHWNWGAFFLGWLWCFANGQAGLGILLIAANCLLTFFNVTLLPIGPIGAIPSELMALVVFGIHCYLGLHGHQYAWERRRFVGGVPQFLSVQRAWAVGGLAAFVGTTLVLTIFGVLFMSAFRAYEASKQQPVVVAAPPPAATGPAPIIL